MYAHNFFSLFPPFPRKNNVFVAMSFDMRFDTRWTQVIAPAIEDISLNSVPLHPNRLDTRIISDSILTDILEGITHDRIIFADITTLGNFDNHPIRSGNVMYEVGLAHAVRLPEEVILFRSDSDKLLFDLASIRINHYDPDTNPLEARIKVTGVIADALREIDLKKKLLSKTVAETLDYPCWMMLLRSVEKQDLHHYPTGTIRQALGYASLNSAITKLLEIGAISSKLNKITSGLLQTNLDSPWEQEISYKITEFGKAILFYGIEQMGLLDPSVLDMIKPINYTGE